MTPVSTALTFNSGSCLTGQSSCEGRRVSADRAGTQGGMLCLSAGLMCGQCPSDGAYSRPAWHDYLLVPGHRLFRRSLRMSIHLRLVCARSHLLVDD